MSQAAPCPMVYVVSSRPEFRKWLETQPAGTRYVNIHNEACARGVGNLYPKPTFVVLKSADIHALHRLHDDGHSVDLPRPAEDPKRRQEIDRWTSILDKWARSLLNQKAP